jgi:hypothetical protein
MQRRWTVDMSSWVILKHYCFFILRSLVKSQPIQNKEVIVNCTSLKIPLLCDDGAYFSKVLTPSRTYWTNLVSLSENNILHSLQCTILHCTDVCTIPTFFVRLISQHRHKTWLCIGHWSFLDIVQTEYLTWGWPKASLLYAVSFSSLYHNTDGRILLFIRKLSLIRWPSLEISDTHNRAREKSSGQANLFIFD